MAARIKRGASGFGDYFEAPPWAGAYQDGSFGYGSPETASYPGPLQAHRDGALGALAGALFINGQELTGNTTITHTGDSAGGGILGPGGEASSVTDGGSLGPGASEGKRMRDVVAYRDGILGNPWPQESFPGPSAAYSDGVVGSPLWESGPDLDMPISGLGAASAANTLDLRDPAVVKELKAALAFAIMDVALAEGGRMVRDELYYQDPNWTAEATEHATEWAARYLAAQSLGPDQESAVLIRTAGGAYPNVKGVVGITAMGVGSPQGDPGYYATNFPRLKAFTDALNASSFAFDQFAVAEPFYSATQRSQGGSPGVRMSTVAMIGLGVVGMIGAAVVYSTLRKKRRT